MESGTQNLARVQLIQTGTEYYQLFTNALSFTLAVSSVDNYVTSDNNELITLAFTLALVAGLLLIIENQIIARYSNITNPQLSRLIVGPVGLLSYILRTTSRVLVHFLSTTLGRWVMTLTPQDLKVGDTITAVAVSISMIWLLGSAIGLIDLPTPPKQEKTQ